MGLQIERIPTLRDNYTYLVICDRTGEAAIVDAPEADPIVRRVGATGAKVRWILSTHHHPDHAAANVELAARFGVPVCGHRSDAGRLPGLTDGLDEGSVVAVGRHRARVLHVPAHTMGHLAYVFDDAGVVLTGDTLFAAGCGRLFEGDPTMMFEALGRLGALPGDHLVYCGHEYTESNLSFARAVEPDNAAIQQRLAAVRTLRSRAAPRWRDAGPEEMTIPSTIALEHATNPFVRATSPEELRRLRERKDDFRG